MTGWLRAMRWLLSSRHHPVIDPIQDERFALWVLDARERTPEGAAIGTPLPDVRAAYPDAEPLTRDGAPALLVCRPHRTYLLCHDGSQVTKIVVGVEDYVRSLLP